MDLAADNHITNVVDEIVTKFSPKKIVLFGSQAEGQPNIDSDVDLLVIMSTKQRTLRKAAEIAAEIEHPLPIDILVRRPEYIATRLNQGDTFISEVMAKGIVVYEA